MPDRPLGQGPFQAFYLGRGRQPASQVKQDEQLLVGESRIGLGSLWIIKKEDWQWLKRQILLKR